MLTVTPLQCILDLITTSKVACTRCQKICPIEDSTSRRISLSTIHQLFDAHSQLKLISSMIEEYDREIAMSISHVDAVLNIPPPEGYMYISITPLEQLRMSLKRCACLLNHITSKKEKDTIDHLWMSCLHGIIAYKSSWYKLFDILEDSQPSLHKMVAVFSRVRQCLHTTSDYILQIQVHHEELYYNKIISELNMPNDIALEIGKYLMFSHPSTI